MSASVFPARAGMSRGEDQSGKTRYRVPRASGDEPHAALHKSLVEVCSPRERG